MEWLIWIAVIVGWFFIKGLMSGESGSKPSEFKIKATQDKRTLEKGNEGINCWIIECKGSIPVEYNTKGYFNLSIVDITGSSVDAVFTKYPDFGEHKNTYIFGQKRPVKFEEDRYYQDWIELFIVPEDLLIFPFKGERQIEFRVVNGSNSMEVEFCVPVNSYFGQVSTTITHTVESIGYREFEKNEAQFEELSIKLALLTASIDGSLDQIELDVIKKWCSLRAGRLIDINENKKKKTSLSQKVKENFQLANNNKLVMSWIVSEMKKKLTKSQHYESLELILDVMAADSILDQKENILIESVVMKLDLDNEKYKKMRDIRLMQVSTSDLNTESSESLFGIEETMTKDEKIKTLNKQYTKWSGQTNNANSEKRKKAKEMVGQIVKIRKKYE